MRRARYFPTVVVGLASFVGQAAIHRTCGAWNSVPASVLSESSDLQNGGYITDQEVQQAGYYDSRPRTNANAQPQSEPESTEAIRKTPMYRGQRVKMPTLPFGRPAVPSQTPSRAAQI